MSQDPNRPVDTTLFEDYLLGRLSDEQVTALDRTLRNDPQARQAFAEAMQVVSLVRQEFADQAEYQAANQQEPLLEDFNTLLKELGEKEAAAQPVVIPVEVDHAEASDQAGSLSGHDYVAAGGYLLRHALRSRPVIIGAAAAILLMATVIGVQFIGDTNDHLAQQPPEVNAPTASTHVATLTAQHEAHWAEGALAPGSQLRAGQSLTLTQGFAEITTEEGAVVILQAPATIEFIDNNNAIRLHAGKLVGICETESSKGLLVRTPHMDITDLGTRFGVAIDKAGNTLAEVFEGSVRVDAREQSNSGFASIEMMAGDVVVLDQKGVTTDRGGFAPEVFASLAKFAAQWRQEGIAGLAGEIQWIANAASLHESEPSRLFTENAWVSLELKDFMLTQDIQTTAHLPGMYDALPPERYGSISAGMRLRSYVIGVQPKASDSLPTGRINKSQGQVTFEGEILGVIANDLHSGAFLKAVSKDRVDAVFPNTIGTIETQTKSGTGRDWFKIQSDRRTIEFYFEASSSTDLIRVLVLEDAQP